MSLCLCPWPETPLFGSASHIRTFGVHPVKFIRHSQVFDDVRDVYYTYHPPLEFLLRVIPEPTAHTFSFDQEIHQEAL